MSIACHEVGKWSISVISGRMSCADTMHFFLPSPIPFLAYTFFLSLSGPTYACVYYGQGVALRLGLGVGLGLGSGSGCTFSWMFSLRLGSVLLKRWQATKKQDNLFTWCLTLTDTDDGAGSALIWTSHRIFSRTSWSRCHLGSLTASPEFFDKKKDKMAEVANRPLVNEMFSAQNKS